MGSAESAGSVEGALHRVLAVHAQLRQGRGDELGPLVRPDEVDLVQRHQDGPPLRAHRVQVALLVDGGPAVGVEHVDHDVELVHCVPRHLVHLGPHVPEAGGVHQEHATLGVERRHPDPVGGPGDGGDLPEVDPEDRPDRGVLPGGGRAEEREGDAGGELAGERLFGGGPGTVTFGADLEGEFVHAAPVFTR